MRSTSVGRAAVVSVLVALLLTTLSSSLVGGKLFASDDTIYTYWPFAAQRPAGWVRPTNATLWDAPFAYHPLLLEARADLYHGNLPLWNPYESGGSPLLGNPQGAFLFPLTWLAFLLPFWSSLAWIAAAKLLLAAAGVYLFCRDLQLRRGPSLLGAIAFAFGLFYFVWLEHTDVSSVWATLPWMFLATRRVCTRGSLSAAALLGGACGLCWLGGHPESSTLVLGVTVAYAAFELIAEAALGRSTSARTQHWRGPSWTTTIVGRTLLLAAVLALGVGVSAVVTIPFAEFLHNSPKTIRESVVPFQSVWSLFFPELWGSPNKAYIGGPQDFNVRTAYFGALPLLLAVGAIGRRRPREQWFFAILAVVSLASSYDTPLWGGMLRSLPGSTSVNLFYLLFVVAFAGGVLAAYGLQRWLTGSARERRQMLWTMGIVALVPALLWIPRHLSLLSHLPSALGQLPAVHPSERVVAVVELGSVWRWILICAVGIGGLALARRSRSSVVPIAVVIVLTGVDLATLDHGYHGQIPLSEANPPVPAAIRYLQAHQGDSRVTATARIGAYWAKLPDRYGLRDARIGDQAVIPVRYERLWVGLGELAIRDYTLFAPAARNAQRLADMFAVRYVLLAPGEPAPSWLTPVLRTAGGTVAFNRTALPRAWVAYDWRSAHSEEYDFPQTLGSTTSQLMDEPVIEKAPAPPSGRTPPPVPARVTADGPNSVTVEATAQRPGYLILDDQAYPGWQATLDGRAINWTPANEAFRAVAIPKGRHVIRFAYRPASVLVGAIISVLSVLALLALGVGGIIWGRRSRNARIRNQDDPSLHGLLVADSANNP